MQVVRTIVWIVITAMLVAFVAMNWEHAPVNFWPLQNGYLRFEWPVGFVALFFFLLGLVPTYLLHRASRWRLGRRIASLENNLKATSALPLAGPVTAPATSPTALEAEAAATRAEHDEP
jgi:putative membrane protein